ncbi:ABC transporter ATP-binding protein [Caviibacter abscessus]|uniref:ABC transporter ATP-binding protein n=1 Tax=Caviibacter abscessus TaxID=1766719 RepID=UPI00083649C8|nr:ABC transporter ATP-binding protein [Caviibacter abscessus]
MFKYIAKEKYRILLVSFIALVLAVLNILPFDMFGNIVDGVNNKTLTLNEVITSVSIMLGSAIFYYLINAANEMITFRGQVKYEYYFQNAILKKILTQTPQYFNKISIGTVMGRITSDAIEYVPNLFGWGLYCFQEGVIRVIVIFIFIMQKIDYKFAILINLPYIVVTLIIITRKRKYQYQYNEMGKSFDKISKKTLETIKGIRIIRAYNMLSKVRKSYIENLKVYSKNNLDYSMNGTYSHALNIVGTAFSYFFLIIYGYYSYANGSISFGDLLGISLTMTLLAWPYTVLAFFINVVFESNIGLKRINEILNAKTVVDEQYGNKTFKFDSKIEFRNFSFSYDDKETLKNISFDIQKGQTIGIIGKTGSGKTTLIKQLLRLYDTNGGIYIDDVDIREYDIKQLRNSFGYSPQEYYIFSDTIKNNILFYRPLEEKLEQSLILADLKKDVENFEKGIETLVGENGVSLSGGQKQRMQIARAIISNPEILIFDDSLSALDTNTEKNIIQNLKDNRNGKTNIIISHRISSLIDADKIVVLNQGKIENIGTHEELLKVSAWYKGLYEYQMKKGDNIEREKSFT